MISYPISFDTLLIYLYCGTTQIQYKSNKETGRYGPLKYTFSALLIGYKCPRSYCFSDFDPTTLQFHFYPSICCKDTQKGTSCTVYFKLQKILKHVSLCLRFDVYFVV